ncbi:MAG TPA: apolipoprotein N-acyltransferase [Bryobacteraceae bacterium]|nr:apolipoprotein N-acyltransferase [Bryobacteraceae bacterium]
MNLFLSVLSGAALVAVFPRFDLAWLAPVCLAPLLVAVGRARHWRERALCGYAAGFAYWFGACYWIQYVLATYGGLGTAGSWGVFLLFCAVKALHMAAFAVAAGAVLGWWWALPAVAALWVAIERLHAPLGFPWQALGNAGIDMGIPMRLAPLTGVYGLSYVFALMNAALALALLRRPRRHLAWVLALPLLYLLPPLPAPRAGNETAVLIQPNLPQEADWTRTQLEETERRISYLSLQASLTTDEPPPRLLVWPEVPAPFYYYADSHFRELVTGLARLARSWTVIGTVAHTPRGEPLNSAVVLAPSGEPAGRYDKIHLVPFGEFVPKYFGFINKITPEAGNFQPGSSLKVFRTDAGVVGLFICYEAAFPHFVRRFAAEGAEVLVNISNDGYFGNTAAREQHLKIARMRAAENRRWLLRATNDGITTAIDPTGRLTDRLPPFQEAALRTHFSWVQDRTLYTRYGDWFAWLCAAGGLLTLLPAVTESLRALRLRPLPPRINRGG